VHHRRALLTRRVEILSIYLPVDFSVTVNHGDLRKMIEAGLGAGKDEAEIVRQLLDDRRIRCTKEFPMGVPGNASLTGKGLHGFRPVMADIKTNTDNIEAIGAHRTARQFYRARNILGNHRTGMKTAGVYHTDDQRLAPVITKLYWISVTVQQIVIGQLSSNGGLAECQCRLVIEVLGQGVIARAFRSIALQRGGQRWNNIHLGR